jgi:SNF family Na+-dependent transporter
MSCHQCENYDPNKPVCQNQDDFNQAWTHAIRYNEKEKVKEAGKWLYVSMVLWFIFLIWAIVVAMRIPKGPERIEHILFALLFSPAYLIASYLGK